MSNLDERIILLAEALRLGVRIEQAGRAYFTGDTTPMEAGMRTLAASREAAVAEQRALLERIAGPGEAGALAARVPALQPDLFAQADGLDRERNHFIKAFRAKRPSTRPVSPSGASGDSLRAGGRETPDPAAKESFDKAMQEFNRRKDELFREAAAEFIRMTPQLRS